jgi:(R,R)-butanediol dehydrogenase / meso-butanediol dehydrogenase / diacetyl reductase
VVRAGFFAGAERFELRELPDPVVADAGVIVDIDRCGICGTDMHAYASGSPYPPAVCGHEWTGIVSAVGRDVEGLREGDRVIIAVPSPCGTCALCRRGDETHCSRSFACAVGRDRGAPPHGGFADRIAVLATRVMKVTQSLPIDVLAQVEPATVTYHALSRTDLRADDLVVVQGAGPIGLLVVQWVRLAGAGHIVVVEPRADRGALAEQLGADTVVLPGQAAVEMVDSLSGGAGGADLVIECVGNGTSIQEAVTLSRRGGSVCLVGMPSGSTMVEPASWITKELTMTTAVAYQRHEFAEVLDHLADGAIDVLPLVSRTVGLNQLAVTLAELHAGSPDLKVLVDPTLD